ncbi:MAG: GNAT family N-acetyltransferase [Ruminococcus sp.]|nr:GNAT family N-acetyltransferase [Ruminococcus sp.]
MFSLREYMEKDAKIILSWITDERSFRQWSADKYKNYPATAEDVNAFYNEIKPNGAMPFMFCDDDKPIGHLIMRPLCDEAVKTVRFGFIIVDSSIRGKGYGKAMLLEALSFAFSNLSAKRVTLGVFENNPKALKCYESAGFKQWGETVCRIGEEDWICFEMECFSAL